HVDADMMRSVVVVFFFFFQAEDGIRDDLVTGVQTCALPISPAPGLGIHVIYKASYDKANRSRMRGARGPGLERGLGALTRVREATGLPILTDVHEPGHVAAAAQGADVLQIPAFLCRQTDLLVAAGRAGRAVNIKKGQWMSPEGMMGAVEKVRAGGAPELAVTERG